MILGGKDEVTPPELALRSALMIPGAKVVFFQDKTHMLIADNQQKIIDEIKLFVDQLNKARVIP
jgi:pimeloyl-ACP methyl ester carboxylesterase